MRNRMGWGIVLQYLYLYIFFTMGLCETGNPPPPPPPAATLHFQNPLGSCYQVQILKKGAIRLEQQLEQPEVGMNTEQLFSTGRLDETLTHV
jgi:hypothetical protein